MSKIDIDKFVASLIEFSPQQSMKYIKALEDQELKYKDGKIISNDSDFTIIANSNKGTNSKTPFNKEKLMEVAKPETPEEKAEAEERAKKRNDNPEFVGIGELGKVWSEQAIISRLDKIIELLQSVILAIPRGTYVPTTIYKNPLDPDPNELGGWKVTANTFGSNHDINTNKIKQNETSKPES